MRVLTCIGDATSLHTWSNIPYFFLQAGQRAGFLDDGWRVDPSRLSLHRLLWNVWRQLRYGERGGFQYSSGFLDRLLAQVARDSSQAEVISHFPLFPPLCATGAELNFYIDATLLQNFEDYGLATAEKHPLGRRIVADALRREREQYAAAERIICMSRWTARSIVNDYAVDPGKVHVVPAGANLFDHARTPEILSAWEPRPPVRLGFIGKDWRRKNLPFLLQVADVLESRGIAVEVMAIGFDPQLGPRHRLLRALGFIDKHTDVDRFVRVVRSWHFGCLFSVAEAFGISNRESIYLGVPVLARDIGGIPDTLPPGCGHLFPADAPAEEVADRVQGYVRDPNCYDELRAEVASHRDEVTWDAAVRKMIDIWNGSDTYSYARLIRAGG